MDRKVEGLEGSSETSDERSPETVRETQRVRGPSRERENTRDTHPDRDTQGNTSRKRLPETGRDGKHRDREGRRPGGRKCTTQTEGRRGTRFRKRG